MVASFTVLIAWLLVVFFLEEPKTSPMGLKKNRIKNASKKFKKNQVADISSSLKKEKMSSEKGGEIELNFLESPHSDEKEKLPSVKEVVKMRAVWVSVGFYTWISFLSTGFGSVFPLWVLQAKEDYGFEWEERHIGTLFAIVGPCYTCAQLFIFPRWVEYIGYTRLGKFHNLLSIYHLFFSLFSEKTK